MLPLRKIRSGALIAGCVVVATFCMPQTTWAKGLACPDYEQLRPLLNSERIEICFGSYGVEVLRQDGNLRIASLYSLEGDERITRTLAVSEFASNLPDTLDTAYRAIRAGATMGATLEAAGWQVEKRQRYSGEVARSKASGCLSGPPDPQAQQSLAVQVYDLYAVREHEVVRFALLAELHDPRYLTLPDLQHLHAATDVQPQKPDAASKQLLHALAEACVLP